MKKETIEQAAERIAYDSTEENKGFPQMKAFIKGAKWQAERMYSEEDLREAYKYGRIWDMTSFEEWLEQFKRNRQDD